MAADAVKYGGENMAGGVVDDALVFLSIGFDDIVTIVAHLLFAAGAPADLCKVLHLCFVKQGHIAGFTG